VTNRTALINDLESLLSKNFKTIHNLTTYQRLNQNDARVTFFKHLVNVIDSTILFLIVGHKYLGDEDWWKIIQQEYSLSSRPIPFYTEFDYYDQQVTISYFHLIFSSFESSIRLIAKTYDYTLYESQRDFSPLCKGLLKKLKMLSKEKNRFADLITSIRNSIHNNGLYVPRSIEKPKPIVWNNTRFHFDENKPIIIKDIWSHLIPISNEIYGTFNDVINSPEIQRIRYYDDPTESSK
jgi:hypothetical protein